MRQQLTEFLGLGEALVHGEKYRYVSESGACYFDALSQYGANPLGGGEQWLVDCARECLQKRTPVFTQPFPSRAVEGLKSRLLRLSNFEGGTAILNISGADAVETALKAARVARQVDHIVAFDIGFHGKTSGAVRVTGNPEYRDYFQENSGGVSFLTATEPERWAIDFGKICTEKSCAAIIFELVQGEGGMHALDRSAVQSLVAQARANDVLVIVDEIQTGLGRTGGIFAFQSYDIEPDVVLLAKALGAGLMPIGASLFRPGILPIDFSLYHSSTFANNGLAADVADRFLDHLESRLLPELPSLEQALDGALCRVLSKYKDVYRLVSGMGLMRGLHLLPVRDQENIMSNHLWTSGLMSYAIAGWLVRDQKLITMPCFSNPSCLRIQPPLNGDQQLVDRIEAALSALGARIRQDPTGFSFLPGNKVGENRRFPLSLVPPLVSGATKGRKKPRIRPGLKSSRRFMFALHPIDSTVFRSNCLAAMGQYTKESNEAMLASLEQLRDISRATAGPSYQISPLRMGGQMIEGQLFSIGWYASELLAIGKDDRARVLRQISQGVVEHRSDVLGLGGFTSIISKGGHSLRALDVDITSGSCLTASAAVDSAIALCDAGFVRVGVVGANGSIGALCWQMLLREALIDELPIQLRLMHNPKNARAGATLRKLLCTLVSDLLGSPDLLLFKSGEMRMLKTLRKLMNGMPPQAESIVENLNAASELCGVGELVEIFPSDDVNEVSSLDLILVATDQFEPLNALNHVKSNTTVLDIGLPHSVDVASMVNAGVKVFDAGLVQFPEPLRIARDNLVGLPEGVLLGCLAETMVTAAAGRLIKGRSPRLKLSDALRVRESAWGMGLSATTVARSVTAGKRIEPERMNLADEMLV